MTLPSSFTVQAGSQCRRLTPANLLDFFWTSRFIDYHCESCKGPFYQDRPRAPSDVLDEEEVSIRTVSLGLSPGPTAGDEGDGPVWRIHDRHLRCLQGTAYISISHVWHLEVHNAHTKREQVNEASHTIVQTISGILEAISTRYSRETELWHDYVSVPQWQRRLQQTLLGCLPKIYANASRTLVHLGDVTESSLNKALGGTRPMERTDGITEILGAKWFSRMWVVLEWSQSSRVHILTRELSIWDNTDDMYWGKIQDTWNEEGDRYHDESNYIGSDALQFRYKGCRFPWQLSGPMATRGKSKLCFGEALNVVSCKDCREWRDKYIAILCLTSSSLQASRLSQSSTGACLELSLAALECGDYSPLLLNSEEGSPSEACLWQKEGDSGGHWLRGYSRMNIYTWCLGDQVYPGTHDIGFEGCTVVLKLDLLGTIKSAMHFSFAGIPIDRFGLIAKIATITGKSIENFAATVATRIYGVQEEIVQECIRKHGTMISDLLAKFMLHSQSNDDVSDQNIRSLSFQLAESIGVTGNELDWAVHGGTMLHGDKQDAVGTIQCGFCHRSTLFRLSTNRVEDIKDASVYVIPGLKYRLTPFRGGVGLIIKDKRIMGRIVYGVRSCECRRLETVYLD